MVIDRPLPCRNGGSRGGLPVKRREVGKVVTQKRRLEGWRVIEEED